MGYAQTIPYSQFELGTSHKAEFEVTTVASDVSLNNIQLPIFLAGKIDHAFLDYYLPYAKNTNVGANHLNTFMIQIKRFVVGGSWTDACSIGADGCALDGSQTADLGRFVGTYDISDEVRTALSTVTPQISMRAYQISSDSDSIFLRYSYGVLRVI